MKNNTIKTILLGAIATLTFAFTPAVNKLTSNKTHVKLFSTTPAEDIEANNYKAVSTIDTETGAVVFSVPMQSFEFELALMQKHYNSSNFLDTKKYPKSKLVGTITNLKDINFKKDGNYTATVTGTLKLHGKTNPIKEKATIIVSGNTIKVKSKFNLTLAEYDIAFEKGKPSTNIAKTVEISVEVDYNN